MYIVSFAQNWRINKFRLSDWQQCVFVLIGEYCSKLKTISSVCLTRNGEQVLLGTEGGNIHTLNITTFSLADNVIYQDAIMHK